MQTQTFIVPSPDVEDLLDDLEGDLTESIINGIEILTNKAREIMMATEQNSIDLICPINLNGNYFYLKSMVIRKNKIIFIAMLSDLIRLSTDEFLDLLNKQKEDAKNGRCFNFGNAANEEEFNKEVAAHIRAMKSKRSAS